MNAPPFAAVFSPFRTRAEMPRSTDRCGDSCRPRSISALWSCRAGPRALMSPRSVSMSALMEELRHALQPLMAVPFGFFGHSVGSWMAYEAARQLRSLDGRTAIHLFVSGRRSPDLAPAPSLPPRPRSDHELLAILDRFGGTPAAIMEHPELLAALLPALRADLALADGYSVDPERHIDCPITALGGADDPSKFRRHSILERVHPRKIPDSSFPWRAFLHLNGRRGSHR